MTYATSTNLEKKLAHIELTFENESLTQQYGSRMTAVRLSALQKTRQKFLKVSFTYYSKVCL
jgi:hypothetical protein